MINYNKLFYFYTVSKSKSLTEAATFLHISQPALSMAIKDLEWEFNTSLFEHKGRNLVLTHAGSILLNECESIFCQEETLLNHMRCAIENKPTSIRFEYMIFDELFTITPFISYIKTKHPFILSANPESTRKKITTNLLDNKIDIGIKIFTMDEIIPELECYTLDQTPLCLVVPTSHHLAKREVVNFYELRNETFVEVGKDSNSVEYQTTMNWGERCGFIPRIEFTTEWVGAALTLVQSGAGVSVLSKFAPLRHMNGLTLVPVSNAPIICSGIFWRRNDYRPAIKTFIDEYLAFRETHK